MTRLFLLFIFAFSANIHALGSKGHWLVCQLAVKELPLAQQNDLTNLIDHFPLAQKQQLNSFLKRPANHSISFADACSWPDAIRHNKQFLLYKSWHYLNVARQQTEVKASACQDKCILEAIPFHQQQFSEAKDPETKIQALLFLAHWIGDIHQPLHVSFKSDLGGNKTEVIDRLNSAKHKCKNLHQIWDSCLLAQSSRGVLLRELGNLPLSSNLDFITTTNILIWANKSLAISRSKSMRYCQSSKNNLACMPSEQQVIFDQSYFDKNNLILKKQLKLAAVRLHLFLSKNL